MKLNELSDLKFTSLYRSLQSGDFIDTSPSSQLIVCWNTDKASDVPAYIKSLNWLFGFLCECEGMDRPVPFIQGKLCDC